MAIKKRVPKASVVPYNAQQYLHELTRQFPNDADLGEYVRDIFHDLSMKNSHVVSVPDI